MPQSRRQLSPNEANQIQKSLVWRKNAPTGALCDWSAIDPAILRGAVDAVTKSGGAIMFGVTADGGAFSICILQGDQKVKEYPHSTEELEEMLKGITQWYVDWKL